jgi:hypothetical protein
MQIFLHNENQNRIKIMADKNKENLNKPREQMADVELSKKLSFAIYENYRIALEFIETNPDYSLLKFRNIIESVLGVIADKRNLDTELKGKDLSDSIDYLFNEKHIYESLKDNLHDSRKLCNDGVHNGSNFNNKEEFYKAKDGLTKKAKIARKILVKMFKDVYFVMDKNEPMAIEPVDIGHNREIIYNALISTDYKGKLKAGIACEAMFREQFYSSEASVSNDVAYNFDELKKITLAFYEAAYRKSVQVDSKEFLSKTDEEIFKESDIESLC